MPTREIPDDIAADAYSARTLQIDGQAKIEQAGKIFRTIANDLTRKGWTQADIAVVLGVSKQRVSQLVNPPAKRATPGK